MPTKKRISVPGAIAHIMARGIDGTDIFRDDADRRFLLEQLTLCLDKTGYLCYGWSLMSNHYHLIVRCSERSLDELMRATHSRYAKYFNKKYKRRGYVFQDRFKSIISQDQRYLEELIRYVHLNPLRAGICPTIEELDRYPWCGHSVLLGKISHRFQTTGAVLKRFGSNVKSSRKRYRDFITEGIKTVKSDWIIDAVRQSNAGVDKKDRPECWVIGDQSFVQSVMTKNEQRLRTRSVLRKKWSIQDVFSYLAKEHNLKPSDLEKRSRLTRISICRQKCAYICCRIIGYSIEDVADYMNISNPAVSWAINRGKELVTKEDVVNFNYLPPG
jgi:putative transposase